MIGSDETVLEVRNLGYRYPNGTVAIENINLKINRGEKVAIIGSNGAGKSTLLSHFNGLKEPSEGDILIEGDIMAYDRQSLRNVRQKVGVVFQNSTNQLFAPTVIEDVAFGPMNLGLSRDEVDRRVQESLEAVDMIGFEDVTPHHLSGGQQKRIAIAGIIAMRPEIIILDEPTASLDPQGVDQVLGILNELNREGITIVISSHDVEMITEFADKVLVLHHGHVEAFGTTEEVFANHQLLKKAHLKPPKASVLLHMLKRRGLDVDVKLNLEEACDEIIDAKMIRK
ncbi:MAG: ATP-binding cassette domain-containing protein [Methanobrevibacter sp.]|jgi:cobalt/nickel transport system ATP-binding protein|nr:ATP-binding cassette domain-containing protein [Methanobrevibacter sp.]